MQKQGSFPRVEWICKHFSELNTEALYQIVQLRIEVFIVEQQCVFQDLDDKDRVCDHLMAWQEDKLVAYTRLVPPGVSYEEPSIGRVVTSPLVRRTGIGRILMEKSIALVHNKYGKIPIKIGAQCYLNKFYTSLGFISEGGVYLEDGIEHVAMRLPV